MGIVPYLMRLLPHFLHSWLTGLDLSNWASPTRNHHPCESLWLSQWYSAATLATQLEIIAELEAEQSIVDANRELIERFESKIQAVLGRVWGKGASALSDA